jgi:CRP-like cAMP-binding protein
MSHDDQRPLRVSAGQPPIFQPGDTGTVWRVRQGVVRLNRPADAGRLPVQLALPGDLIGIEALCDQPYQFCAEAFTDCELEPVPLGTAGDGEALRQALLREVLLQQQSRSQDMATLRTGSVLERMVHLLRLLGLPWQGAQPVTGGQADAIRQALPTLREVAELVDAKTETVCRVLAQLLPPRSRKGGPARKPMAAVAVQPQRPVGAWSSHGLALGVT